MIATLAPRAEPSSRAKNETAAVKIYSPACDG
jgi:hypothetical protein